MPAESSCAEHILSVTEAEERIKADKAILSYSFFRFRFVAIFA
jgi:hypothetical protein